MPARVDVYIRTVEISISLGGGNLARRIVKAKIARESANITTCKSYEKARNRGIHTYRNSSEDGHYASDKCDGSSETPSCSGGTRPRIFFPPSERALIIDVAVSIAKPANVGGVTPPVFRLASCLRFLRTLSDVMHAVEARESGSLRIGEVDNSTSNLA